MANSYRPTTLKSEGREGNAALPSSGHDIIICQIFKSVYFGRVKILLVEAKNNYIFRSEDILSMYLVFKCFCMV